MGRDTTRYVQPLSAPEACAVAYAGGKGAALARLSQAGVPVPPGWVLSPEALRDCLMALALSPNSRPDLVCQALQTARPPAALEASIQAALTVASPAVHGWAVRSSAVTEDGTTASYAGMYESFLAVAETDLWRYVCSCWASWWSARALAYRQHLGLADSTPGMAVVVQHMVPARCAGVAFTVEPLHGDANRMVIQAAPGLATAVVTGVMQPEQYILAKTPELRVLDTRLLHPGQPPLLPQAVLAVLSTLLQRLEILCGQPQDVEWAWDGVGCWIVQSRPITTLDQARSPQGTDVWGNANLKDVMPGLVSPLTWSLMQPQLEATMRQQYQEAGYTVPANRPLLRRFWGRPYFNISCFHEVAYRLYGVQPEQQTAQLGGMTVPGQATPPPASLWQRLHWLGNMLRFASLAKRARKRAPAQFQLVHHQWQTERQEIPRLDRQALLAKLEQRTEVMPPFLLLHLHLSWAMSGNFSALRDLVASVVPQLNAAHESKHTPASLASVLVTGLGDVSSAEHSYRLWELSRQARQLPQVMAFLRQGTWTGWQQRLASTAFAEAWQEFLETYGHRAIYEVEMANPRWREQPDYLFAVLAAYAQMPQAQAPFTPQTQAQQRQEAEYGVLRHLSWWQRLWFRLVLQRARAFSRLRENSKSHLVQLIDIGRLLALRAGWFLVQDGLLEDIDAVFELEMEEVLAALHGTLPPEVIRQRITQRRLARQRDATRQPPDLFVGARPVYTANLAPHGLVLSGLPSSPGRVTGTARVLYTPHEQARLQPGEILVAPSTDPGWTPLFLLASGLVMETGGYLSHGAIVAREYGIPAVINVPLATQRIADGSTICLDGAQGTVQLLP